MKKFILFVLATIFIYFSYFIINNENKYSKNTEESLNLPEFEKKEVSLETENNQEENKKKDLENKENIKKDTILTKNYYETKEKSLNYEEILITATQNLKEVNENARKAIVNIFCTSKTSGYFKPASGSGVFLNKEGLILTNAHVAQYVFLSENIPEVELTCIARIGNPAKSNFKIKTVYIPEIWIKDNAKNINSFKLENNGKNDFALLQIVSKVSSETITENFNFLKPETNFNLGYKDKDVVVASYPADKLGGILTQMDLSVVSSIGKIENIYSFSHETPDLFLIGNSLLAQGGSSGGAVSYETGKLLALISTATLDKEKDKKIGAITMFHVKESLENIFGEGVLDNIILNNISQLNDFMNKKYKEYIIEFEKYL